MAQTTVNEYRAQYVAGQNLRPDVCETKTKIAGGAMEPGDAVIKGSTEDDVAVPAAAFTQTTFRGIVVYNPASKEKALTTGSRAFAEDEPVEIMKEGEIAVLVEDTVTEGGIVFFVHTTGGASTLNTYRSDLDTDKAAEIPARFLKDGVSGDLVPIRVSVSAGLGSILS